MSNSPDKQETRTDTSSPPAGQLSRGLLIIQTVIEAPAPMTLTELAERTGLDPSSALRITQILMSEGYLVRQHPGKRYCAGPRALSMLSPYHPLNVFRRDTAEILHQLRDEIGATVGLVLFLGTQRLIVDLAQGIDALAPFYDTWLRTPLHAAASGKLLLARLGPKQKRELLGKEPLPAATPHTITKYSELEDMLTAVREDGYAISRDDVHVGLTAVAAPIEHGGTAVGCIVTVGSSHRFSNTDCGSAGQKLRDAARLIATATPSVRSLAHYVGA